MIEWLLGLVGLFAWFWVWLMLIERDTRRLRTRVSELERKMAQLEPPEGL